jgi:hypothetical protein
MMGATKYVVELTNSTMFVLVALILFMIAATIMFSVRNQIKMDEIHDLVNSRLSRVIARVTQLTRALEASGVAVPKDPNADVADDEEEGP